MRYGLLGVVWLGLVSLAMGADYRPGDKVVVIAEAKLRVEQTEVDKVWPGLVLQVGDVNGEFLWLGQGKPGWLEAKHVIPLDRAAIDRLTILIRNTPREARLYSRRASVWRALGEVDIAIADLNEAIRLSPSAAYYNNRGLAWKQKKEYDKAISDYNEALRLDPTAAEYLNLGTAWFYKQEYDKAISGYDEAIRLDAKVTNAYNGRGNAWLAKKEYGKAIRDYDEAIRLDAKFVDAYNGRANACAGKQEYDKAISDYDEALRLDPKYAQAVFNRADAYRFQREYAKAIDGFQQTIDMQGWSGDRAPYAVIMGSLTAREAQDEPRSKQFLTDSAGKLRPEWPEPIVRYLDQRFDEAALEKLAVDDEKRTEFHAYVGLDLMLRGQTAAARRHLEWVRDHGNRTFTEYPQALEALKRLPPAKP